MVLVFVLGAVTVFISGQRGSWVGVCLGLVVLSLRSGTKGLLFATLLFIGALVLSTTSLVDEAFWSRMSTVSEIFDAKSAGDTSIEQRGLRWQWGYDATIESPLFGVGYGHWLMHNAFLEISSTLGLLPAITFLIFIVQLIVRIMKAATDRTSQIRRNDAWTMLGLSVMWIGQLSVETVFQTPPFAMAHWAVMAVAWYLPNIKYHRHDIRRLGSSKAGKGENAYRIGAYIQLRKDRPTMPGVGEVG
jgi:O-antigen ligase